MAVSMKAKLVNLARVCKATGFTRQQIRRLESQQLFPSSIYVPGSRYRYYNLTAILRYMRLILTPRTDGEIKQAVAEVNSQLKDCELEL